MKNIGSGRDYDTLEDYYDALVALTETDYQATCFDSPVVPVADWDYSANPVKIYAQQPTKGLEGVGTKLEPASGNCLVASGDADVEFIGFEVAIPDDGDGYNAAAIDQAGTRLRLTKCLFKHHSTALGAGGLAASNTGAHVILEECWIPADHAVPYIGIGAFNPGDSRVFLRNCKVATNGTGVGAGTAFIAGEGTAKVIFNNLQVLDVDGNMVSLFGANVEQENSGHLITTADGTIITHPTSTVVYHGEDPADIIQSLDLSDPDLRWKSRAEAVARPGSDLSAANAAGIDGVTRESAEDKTIIGGDTPPEVPVIDVTTQPYASWVADPYPAHKDKPFSASLRLSAGRGPITWSLSGDVPAGLTISAQSAEAEYGILEGPVTDDLGDYTFNIRATDAYGQYDEIEITLPVEAASKFYVDTAIADLGMTLSGVPGNSVEVVISTEMGQTIDGPVRIWGSRPSGFPLPEISLVGAAGPWVTMPDSASPPYLSIEPVDGAINTSIWLRIPGSADQGDLAAAVFIESIAAPSADYAIFSASGTIAASEAAMRVRLGAADGPILAPSDLLDFGNVHIGRSSAWRQIFIINETAGTLTVENPALSGDEPGEFEVDFAAIDLTLDVDQATSFRVRFKPTTEGAGKGADLTFMHDDPETGSPFALELAGNATAALPPADEESEQNNLDLNLTI